MSDWCLHHGKGQDDGYFRAVEQFPDTSQVDLWVVGTLPEAAMETELTAQMVAVLCSEMEQVLYMWYCACGAVYVVLCTSQRWVAAFCVAHHTA